MRTNTRYIVLLSVLTLTLLVSQVFLQQSISRSQMDSYIINVSGRQRMLSQKIAKHALQLRTQLSVPNWEVIIPKMNATLKDWEDGLLYLTEGEGASLSNADVRKLFNQAKPYFAEIQTAASEITRMHASGQVDVEKTEAQIEIINRNEEAFLDLMDKITYSLDEISQDKITSLRTIEMVLLTFTLFILSMEVYLIYQPLRKTLRKKTEDVKNLSNIIDSLENYSVLFLNQSYQILDCNRGAFLLFNYTKEEILGKTISELFGQELLEKFQGQQWEENLEHRGMAHVKGIHLKNNKEELYADSTLLKVLGQDGKQIGFTLITLDQTIYQKNRVLAAQNRELEKFNYIASHDLKEPLRTIKGFLSLMETEYQNDLNDNYRTMMTHIVHSADRMENLIQSLLSYAQTGSNIQKIELDLNTLVKAVLNDLNELVDQRKAEIDIAQLPNQLGGSIELRQLFQNLISNAIKYTPTDRTPRIKIRVGEENQHYHFTIEDNGYGIEEKYLTEIFQPFKRLHGTESAEGQGLGLAHCQKIVELHRGKMWVESIVNKGSTFHFTLSKSA